MNGGSGPRPKKLLGDGLLHVGSTPPLVARPQGPGKVLASQVQKVLAPAAVFRGNFSKAPEQEIFDMARPMEKPMSIGPPETLREARLSPWWPQYKEAMGVEICGHTENGTWIVVSRQRMPRGTNLIRGKWVVDDKRGEDGKIIKFKAAG